MYMRPHKHTSDTNYIVKIIQTTLYQQSHNYFNLIIFNEILLIYKPRNINEVQLRNSLRLIQIYQNIY